MFFHITNNVGFSLYDEKELEIIYCTETEKAYACVKHLIDEDDDKHDVLTKILESNILCINGDHFLIDGDLRIEVFSDFNEENEFEIDNLFATHEGMCGLIGVLGRCFSLYEDLLDSIRTCDKKILQILGYKHELFEPIKVSCRDKEDDFCEFSLQ